MRLTLKLVAKRRPVLVFLFLTYLFTWAFWSLNIRYPPARDWIRMVGGFGPTLAGLILIACLRGRPGLRQLGQRLLRWRVGGGWYLFAFLSTALASLVAIYIAMALGMPRPRFNDPRQLYLVVPAFLYVLFTSVLGEEIGWRGFALPHLQQARGPLVASFCLGVAWGIWHLPLFWTPGNFYQGIPVWLFLMQSLGFAFLYTWLYNHTGKSLWIIHLFHAASNTTLGVLPVLPLDTGGDLRPLYLLVTILWLVVGGILVLDGPELGWRKAEEI
jgi:hypothetical protein